MCCVYTYILLSSVQSPYIAIFIKQYTFIDPQTEAFYMQIYRLYLEKKKKKKEKKKRTKKKKKERNTAVIDD